ncbi:MAG TPA: hypothetical protein VF170_00800 [Planctomycetaceae bacterium]
MKTWFMLALGLLATATFLGCGETPQPAAEEPVPATETAGEGGEVNLSEAEIQALAEEQKVCAVTGEPLGSMGTPVPVRVTDSKGEKHTVLLCCESCREDLLENPDEHLAKLAAAGETSGEADAAN